MSSLPLLHNYPRFGIARKCLIVDGPIVPLDLINGRHLLALTGLWWSLVEFCNQIDLFEEFLLFLINCVFFRAVLYTLSWILSKILGCRNTIEFLKKGIYPLLFICIVQDCQLLRDHGQVLFKYMLRLPQINEAVFPIWLLIDAHLLLDDVRDHL